MKQKKISSNKTSSHNSMLALTIGMLALSMALFSFASVPLYNLFCKATGFGGVTQRTYSYTQNKRGTKKILVRFNASIDMNLPWRFTPKQTATEITPGENSLVFYEVENLSDQDVMGTAVYNVTPNKAGQYFVKIHCFCFEEQLLKAHQKILLPVSFYLEPDIESDQSTKDIDEITLSYSFFRVK